MANTGTEDLRSHRSCGIDAGHGIGPTLKPHFGEFEVQHLRRCGAHFAFGLAAGNVSTHITASMRKPRARPAHGVVREPQTVSAFERFGTTVHLPRQHIARERQQVMWHQPASRTATTVGLLDAVWEAREVFQQRIAFRP